VSDYGMNNTLHLPICICSCLHFEYYFHILLSFRIAWTLPCFQCHVEIRPFNLWNKNSWM